MKIYGCQLDIAWENKPANFAKVRRLVEGARPPRGSLIVLPEMFATGFSMNAGDLAEGSAAPAETFLADLARSFDLFVMGGVINVGPDGRGRNEAVTFDPRGGLVARYAKMQPFSLGGELDHYTAGDRIVTFDCESMRVAPFVCYDLRFPELFRAAMSRDVHLFAVIANWPVKRIAHWITLLQARAIENQAYVIGVNRTGSDPKHSYNGRSLVVDPHGEILVDAASDESIFSAEVDLARVLEWRAEFPALRDRRAEAYSSL